MDNLSKNCCNTCRICYCMSCKEMLYDNLGEIFRSCISSKILFICNKCIENRIDEKKNYGKFKI